MPFETAVLLAGIVLVFAAFAAVLAWGRLSDAEAFARMRPWAEARRGFSLLPVPKPKSAADKNHAGDDQDRRQALFGEFPA